MTDQTVTTNSAPTNGHSIINGFDVKGKSAFNGEKQKPIDLVNALKGFSTDELGKEAKTELRKWAKEYLGLTPKTVKKNPGKIYDNLFSGKSMSQEQMLRQSMNTVQHFAPQSVLGLIQKRIKGAQSRIVSTKNDIQDLRFAIKTGVIEKKGKNIAITPAEKKSLQQKKLHAEAELIKAKDDMSLFKQNLAEALSKNAAPLRDDIKSVRESAHIRRLTPSISQQIADSFAAHSELKDQLLNLKNDPAREEVANTFLNIVKAGNGTAYKIISAKPKLATQVRQRVFELITK